MKVNSYKRVLAYLVDVMIISFVSLLLTYFVPTSENYNKLNKEFENLTIDYRNQEVTMEEYLEKGTDINYQLNKEGVPQTIVSTVLSIIYFVVLTYFMNGETSGVTNAINGTCDIGMASRGLKDSEKAKGVAEITIAIDGIAVVVNKENPAANLTKAQVEQIFTGKITKWNEVK